MINATTEDDKIKIVGSYLSDSAQKWFQEQNWSNHAFLADFVGTNIVGNFQKRFLAKYMTPEKQAFLEREFWQRQQGGNKAAYYYYRDKLRLYERCTLDTSDVKFISQVVNGLTRLYADMYLGGPPTTLDGLVQGLTNADHCYFGNISNMFPQPIFNAQATNNMQLNGINQIRSQEANQVNAQNENALKTDFMDQIADKIFSKMDALVEKKLEQRLSSNAYYNNRRNMKGQQRISKGYRSEVNPPVSNRYNGPERTERRNNVASDSRPNRGCFNCGSLEHCQYDCRNPCGKCGGDHVARVCQQAGRQPTKSHGTSNSIVTTIDDDYEDDDYYNENYQQQDFQFGYHM